MAHLGPIFATTVYRFSLAVAVGLWISCCYIYTSASIKAGDDAYIVALRARSAGRAIHVAERLDTEFRAMSDLAEAFAMEPEAVSLLTYHAPQSASLISASVDQRRSILAAAPDVQTISEYYRQIIDDTNYNLVFLLDPAGTCVAASNWKNSNSILGQNYGDRAYFRDALAGGVGQEFAVGRAVAVPAFFFARPIRAGGKIIGAAVVRKRTDTLAAAATSSGAQTLVFDADGMVVASNRADLILSRARFLSHGGPPPDRAIYGTGRIHDLDIDAVPSAPGVVTWNGVRYLSVVQGLDRNPFSVWIAAPIDDREEIHWALAETGIFAAGAGLLLGYLLDRIIAHILRRRMDAIALATTNEALTSSNERLSEMARTDLLTGCSNRRHFIERATESLAHARRSGRPRTLVMLDLDHFKRINDTYGHPAGDLVLIRTVQTCVEIIRATDVFGRIGGEEFGLCLWDTEEAGARLLVERLRIAIAGLEVPNKADTIRLTASFGLAQMLPNEEFESLYSRADAALYLAKSAGRNRFAVA